MKTLGYKVVTQFVRHVYKSCINPCDIYSLEYVIGEKTVPVVGKIFIFDTLRNAVLFRSQTMLPILQVEYDNDTAIIPASVESSLEPWLYQQYWAHKLYQTAPEHPESFLNKFPPLGTLLVDWVIPTEEVCSSQIDIIRNTFGE